MQEATLVQSGNSTSTLRITQGSNMSVQQYNSSKPSAGKSICAGILLCAAMAVAAQAQYVKLVDFNGANGSSPRAPLIQGLNGHFYGTTVAGGTHKEGTVFEIASDGAFTTTRSFCAGSQLYCSTYGAVPYGPLVLAGNGNFYEMLYLNALSGGVQGGGTILRLTSSGGATKIADICPSTACADGAAPTDGLVEAVDGNFYGTTSSGGNFGNPVCGGCGTVIKVTPAGSLTNLYSFCSATNCTDGAVPLTGLVQGTDGNFYGTTSVGGVKDAGTVFKILSDGTFTTLYSFCKLAQCADGKDPSGLMQADDGNFYGTTNATDTGYGTLFRITPTGALTTLSSFCSQPSCTDGATPVGALIQATDGKLYGTTSSGGVSNRGTIFRATLDGTLTRVHSFAHLMGISPAAGLVQGTDGSFYGTTSRGGTSFHGTAFRFSTGLGPFVKTVRPYGAVSSTVTILGNSLTGTSSVTFNGTAAAFTLVSDTEITATVPTGATTGTIQVVTPGGTLTSNVAFRVF